MTTEEKQARDAEVAHLTAELQASKSLLSQMMAENTELRNEIALMQETISLQTAEIETRTQTAMLYSERAEAAVCPYVVATDEGTHYCQLEGAAAEVAKLRERAEKAEAENDILRGITARLMPCRYCGVDDMAKCPSGFPGCGLADDLFAGEDGILAEARQRVEQAEAVVIAAREYAKSYRDFHQSLAEPTPPDGIPDTLWGKGKVSEIAHIALFDAVDAYDAKPAQEGE